ncbi:MAG TPA: hypothetical protein VIB02_05825 [Candidatus Limnocylindrales bacterium]|jgi:hypothetical protein
MITAHRAHGVPTSAVIVRLAILGLTLATAVIHARLGGTLFLLNAAGYVAFVLAMVLPGPVRRIRWLVRYGLIGFTAMTIGGWVAFGARFELAYIDKAIEVALIGLLLVESYTVDGSPLAVLRRASREAVAALR